MRTLAAACALACTLAGALAARPDAALAQPGLAWETPEQGAVAGLLQLKVFHTRLINTGDATGSYRVTMTVDGPTDWVTSMCEGDFCYAPFVRTFDFTLAPGDTNDIGANITPVGVLGATLVGIDVVSLDDPGLTAARAFTVVTPGLDVLIVAADELGDPVPLNTAALAAVGKTAAAWSAKAVGAPDAAALAAFPTVLWAAGAAIGGIDADARDALGTYVQQGGHLWLSGANLAFSLGSPASPAYSPAAQAWLHDVAGVDWVAFSAGAATVAGVPGDELGDGLALGLNGGDSAGNNTSPDVIAAGGGGTACLAYGTGTTAGVRRVWGAGRIVTTAFAPEGVETAAQRTALAAAVLGWYVGGTSAVGGVPAAPLAGARAVPNPFNPRTELVFALGGATAQDVTVGIHDLRGRLVRRLLAPGLLPGSQRLPWDGRDAAGRSLPAGVYVARIASGDATATVRMTLVK